MKDFLILYALEIILLCLIVILLLIGIKSKSGFAKHLLFNLSAIFIAVFIFELTLTIRNKPQSYIDYSNRYYTANPELGYGVSDSSFSIRATKRWIKSDKEIYSANYSFANGRRVTPGSDTTSQQYSIFLGGSFTFGEGLNDTETLPYYYNQLYPQKRNIINYGFHGYGTHQVYTIVKNQIANDTTLEKAENVDVYYWFIDPHILRANGYSSWDQNSPKYIMENGILKTSGSFKRAKESRVLVEKLFDFVWTNSNIYQRIKSRLSTRKEEVSLFLTLVKETDLILKEKGFRFTVLIHNQQKQDPLFGKHYTEITEKIVSYLKEQDIPFIVIDKSVSKGKNITDLLFIPGDGHPTGEFNKRLAEYLWKERQVARQSGNN
ncbi:hypothetical protein [Roseivirga sp.]|uniref:hypothetical protein n=1 Tax=Roseivirga sp. TaxID=1964215 RepID=UPI003B8D798C